MPSSGSRRCKKSRIFHKKKTNLMFATILIGDTANMWKRLPWSDVTKIEHFEIRWWWQHHAVGRLFFSAGTRNLFWKQFRKKICFRHLCRRLCSSRTMTRNIQPKLHVKWLRSNHILESQSRTDVDVGG